jgi:Tol biopolymer transport system component/DNA-binding winged helix-turn-helix (wHTH) protein
MLPHKPGYTLAYRGVLIRVTSPAKPNLVSFGVYEFNSYTGELRKKGMRVRLEGQPLAVLQMLLDRSGELVTREELQKRLWPVDTFVDFDHSLNAAIRRLREALGDSAENPRFVETVARRGYRFLMPQNGAIASVAPTPQTISGSKMRALLGLAAVLLIVTGLGWIVAYRPRHSTEIRQRRLTANSQEDPVLGGVISPDGKYLVFSDKAGLCLRQIDNGENHPVSLPKGFNVLPAAWYPDGTHLVATWVERPNSPSSLWQVSIVGGAPRKLIDDGRFASVSHDGSQIAFVRGTNLDEELWVMGGNGEKPKRLLAAPHRCVFGVPAWSPDGRRIAYVSGTYEPAQWGIETNIATLDLGNGRQEVIALRSMTQSETDHNPQLGQALAWTSDNHFIYSISEPTSDDHDSNVWSLPVDSRGHVTGPASKLTAAPDAVSNLNVSADGKRIVYTKYSLNPSIYISDLHSVGTRLSPPRRLTLDDWKDFPFAWTPDSKAVLFVSDRDGLYHIFKQQIDQAVPEVLVGGNEQANVPRLAPDNSTVLYVIWPKLGGSVKSSRLMRVPLAGGPPQAVLQRDGIGNLQCARLPSTLCLYHVGTATQLSFFRFDPVAGTSEELPQLRIEDQAPHAYNWSLSPDGKILATVKAEGVQKDPSIVFHSVEDGSKRTVTIRTWAGISGIDFAADGRSLWIPAYTNTGKWALLNIDLNGHAKVVLEDTDREIGWAIPSPDGKHLALLQAHGASNVWMLER